MSNIPTTIKLSGRTELVSLKSLLFPNQATLTQEIKLAEKPQTSHIDDLSPITLACAAILILKKFNLL